MIFRHLWGDRVVPSIFTGPFDILFVYILPAANIKGYILFYCIRNTSFLLYPSVLAAVPSPWWYVGMIEISPGCVDQLFFSLKVLLFDAPAGGCLSVSKGSQSFEDTEHKDWSWKYKNQRPISLILWVSPTFLLYTSEFKTLPKHLYYPLKLKIEIVDF